MTFHGETMFKTEVRRGGRRSCNGVYRNMQFSVNLTYGDGGLKKMLEVRNTTKRHDVTKPILCGKI